MKKNASCFACCVFFLRSIFRRFKCFLQLSPCKICAECSIKRFRLPHCMLLSHRTIYDAIANMHLAFTKSSKQNKHCTQKRRQMSMPLYMYVSLSMALSLHMCFVLLCAYLFCRCQRVCNCASVLTRACHIRELALVVPTPCICNVNECPRACSRVHVIAISSGTTRLAMNQYSCHYDAL